MQFPSDGETAGQLALCSPSVEGGEDWRASSSLSSVSTGSGGTDG